MDAGMGAVKGRNFRNNVSGLTADPLYQQSTVTIEEQMAMVENQPTATDQQAQTSFQTQQQYPSYPAHQGSQMRMPPPPQQQQQPTYYQPKPAMSMTSQQNYYQGQQPMTQQRTSNQMRGNTMPHYRESPMAAAASHKAKATFGNIFKKKGSSRGRDDFNDDKDEDVELGPGESQLVSFNDISGFRNSGGPSYGNKNATADTAPIIPTIMSDVNADASKLNNVEYRKMLNTQKKLAMSNFGKFQQQQQQQQQQQSPMGFGSNIPRAMSMQQMPPRAMSMQNGPPGTAFQQFNAASPQFRNAGTPPQPPPSGAYSRSNSMMNGVNPMNPQIRSNPGTMQNGPPRAMTMQTRPPINQSSSQFGLGNSAQTPPALGAQQQKMGPPQQPGNMTGPRAMSMQSRPNPMTNNSFVNRPLPTKQFAANQNPTPQTNRPAGSAGQAPQTNKSSGFAEQAHKPTSNNQTVNSSPLRQTNFLRKSSSSIMLNKFTSPDYPATSGSENVENQPMELKVPLSAEEKYAKPSIPNTPVGHQKSLSANLRPASLLMSGLDNSGIDANDTGKDNQAYERDIRSNGPVKHKHSQSKAFSVFTNESSASPTKPSTGEKSMYAMANNTTDMNLYYTANQLPEQVSNSSRLRLDGQMKTEPASQHGDQFIVDGGFHSKENLSYGQNHIVERPSRYQSQDGLTQTFQGEDSSFSSRKAEPSDKNETSISSKPQHMRTTSVNSVTASTKSSATSNSKASLKKAKNFFRKFSSNKKGNSQQDTEIDSFSNKLDAGNTPSSFSSNLDQRTLHQRENEQQDFDFAKKSSELPENEDNLRLAQKESFKFRPVSASPPLNTCGNNKENLSTELWNQPFTVSSQPVEDNQNGNEETKSFHSLFSTPSMEKTNKRNVTGSFDKPVSIHSFQENTTPKDSDSFDEEPTFNSNKSLRARKEKSVLPQTQENSPPRSRDNPFAAPLSKTSTSNKDEKVLYAPSFVSKETAKQMAPALITVNDTHNGFKSFFIDPEQLNLLNENKRLVEELAIVSKELTESFARELELETKSKLFLNDASTKGRYGGTGNVSNNNTTDQSNYFNEMQKEMRKKSSRIVSLIQEVNEERLKRFIAEEQVLLFEKGVQPSALQLTQEIEMLKRALKEKDDEIQHLKGL
ncbi:hypothetical protein ACO0RG_001386 [Hanseniaspora osmophila]